VRHLPSGRGGPKRQIKIGIFIADGRREAPQVRQHFQPVKTGRRAWRQVDPLICGARDSNS
jgi:hypothetical protein